MYRISLLCCVWILGWSVLCSQSSQVIADFFPCDDKPRTEIILPHPDGKRSLLLVIGKRDALVAQMIGPGPELGKSHLLYVKKGPLPWELSPTRLIAYLAPTDRLYQLFLFRPGKDVLSLLTIDTGTGEHSLKPLMQLDRKEELVGWVSDEQQLVICTMESRSSRVGVYRFTSDGLKRELHYDLSHEEFPSRFGTLSSIFAGPNGVDDPAIAKARGISSEVLGHLPGPVIGHPAKLYLDDDQLVMTLDVTSDYTIAIKFSLVDDSAEVHRFDPTFTDCTSERYPRMAGSHYYQGELWQAKGCKEGMMLQVFDLDSEQLLHREELTAAQIQLAFAGKRMTASGILPDLLQLDGPGDQGDADKFLRNLEQNPPRLSVVNLPGGQQGIRLQVVGENLALTALAGFGGMMVFGLALYSTGVGVMFAPSQFSSGSLTYQGVLEPGTFSNPTQDQRLQSAQSLSPNLMEDADNKGKVKVHFIQQGISWVVSTVRGGNPGYWLLRMAQN